MLPKNKRLLRNFVIEMTVYGVLLVVYFWVVLNTIGEWLAEIFNSNLTLYAFLALFLIVAQGVFLESITTLLIKWLGLERIE